MKTKFDPDHPLDHYLVVSSCNWGRGATISEAVRNAKFISVGDKVHLLRCDAKATMSDTGVVYAKSLVSVGMGILTRGKQITLGDEKPE